MNGNRRQPRPNLDSATFELRALPSVAQAQQGGVEELHELAQRGLEAGLWAFKPGKVSRGLDGTLRCKPPRKVCLNPFL